MKEERDEAGRERDIARRDLETLRKACREALWLISWARGPCPTPGVMRARNVKAITALTKALKKGDGEGWHSVL